MGHNRKKKKERTIVETDRRKLSIFDFGASRFSTITGLIFGLLSPLFGKLSILLGPRLSILLGGLWCAAWQLVLFLLATKRLVLPSVAPSLSLVVARPMCRSSAMGPLEHYFIKVRKWLVFLMFPRFIFIVACCFKYSICNL